MGRKGFVRERILDAAFDSFAKQGYEAVSTRDIAKQAGVGHASMYKHFESKEALGKEVYRICLQPIIDRFIEIQSEHDTQTDAIAQINGYLFELYDERPRALALLIFLPHDFTPWQLAKRNPKSPRSILLSLLNNDAWLETVIWGIMATPLQDRYLKRITGSMRQHAPIIEQHLFNILKNGASK